MWVGARFGDNEIIERNGKERRDWWNNLEGCHWYDGEKNAGGCEWNSIQCDGQVQYQWVQGIG